MSDIVLSASVRQNLLSLQSTADLLAQTQNRLSTGKKVNTALDNPTNYFTAAALDNRANDINNLLDGIGNGVQVLQAANTGLTSLQKLVDTAKSVANQVLQSQVGYSQKSSVDSLPVTGATALDLRGTTPFTNAAATPGTALKTGTANAAATGATLISALTDGAVATPTGPAAGDSFSVNGKTITFAASGAATTDAGGNVTIGIDQTLSALTGVIDTLDGNTAPATASSVNGSGQIALNTGIAHDLALTNSTPAGVLAKLGLTAGTTARGGGAGNLDGKTLTIGATGGGVATNITFGDGTNGTVKTLNDLNAQLASNNLQATINTAGVITISTANDAAAATIGAIGGTAAGAGYAFNGLVAAAPVQDPAVQASRAGLVNQYNNIIQQINTTAADSSFNGINLLNGDTLKLVFNETGKSVAHHHRHQHQCSGPRTVGPDGGHRLPGQRLGQQRDHEPRQGVDHPAHAGLDARLEPVDRADPSGLLEEPDQRAADRLGEPDARRHQRGSGEQPGAVHPAVDRGVRTGAGQPVAAERAATAPLMTAAGVAGR